MVKKAQHSVLGMVSSRLNSRIFFGGSVKMFGIPACIYAGHRLCAVVAHTGLFLIFSLHVI